MALSPEKGIVVIDRKIQLKKLNFDGHHYILIVRSPANRFESKFPPVQDQINSFKSYIKKLHNNHQLNNLGARNE